MNEDYIRAAKELMALEKVNGDLAAYCLAYVEIRDGKDVIVFLYNIRNKAKWTFLDKDRRMGFQGLDYNIRLVTFTAGIRDD